MYISFYGLERAPFDVTPDPRFIFLNDCYREAVTALDRGLAEGGGAMSLIGEAGTGKTTLIRRMLGGCGPRVNTVLLLNPRVSFDEILEYALLELGIPMDGGEQPARLRRLNQFLSEQTRTGGSVALVIDDAQHLEQEVLRELHRLAGGEGSGNGTLRVVLAGQPELGRKLSAPTLHGFASTIRLRALAPEEVCIYVRTRLERAGARDPDLFTAGALKGIATFSEGVPRVVNTLCHAALLGAFATGHVRVSARAVDEAWRDYTEGRTYPARVIDPPSPTPAAPSLTAVADGAGVPDAPSSAMTEDAMEGMARRVTEIVGVGRDVDRHIRDAGIAGIDGVVGLYTQLRAALGEVSRQEIERTQSRMHALRDELGRCADQLAQLLAIASAVEAPAIVQLVADGSASATAS